MNLSEPNVHITPQNLITEGAVVLGVKGSGKSNSVAVIVEEAAALVPFIILDPHGEYWTLKEKFDALVIGDSDHVDLHVSADQIADVVGACYERGVSVIIDMLYVNEDEREAYVVPALSRVWELAKRQRKPYVVVLEEAHNFIPEHANTPSLKRMATIAKEGRKFGLGMVLCTQDTASISKQVLRMMLIRFLHQVYDPSDVKKYQAVIPLPPAEVKAMIGALKVGEAIVVQRYTPTVVTIRRRHTTDAGNTPNLADVKTRPVDAAMLEEMRKLLAAPPTDDSDEDAIRRLHAEYKLQLQEQARAYEQRIAELQAAHARERPVEVAAVTKVRETALAEIDGKFKSSRSRQMAINRQNKAFEKLLVELGSMARATKNVLAWLIENEQKTYSAEQLARVLDYDKRTIWKATATLRERNLVAHWANATFQSEVSILFRDRYPMLDQKQLLAQVIQCISE